MFSILMDVRISKTSMAIRVAPLETRRTRSMMMIILTINTIMIMLVMTMVLTTTMMVLMMATDNNDDSYDGSHDVRKKERKH